MRRVGDCMWDFSGKGEGMGANGEEGALVFSFLLLRTTYIYSFHDLWKENTFLERLEVNKLTG